MIGNIFSELVVVATAGLVLLPIVSRRFGRSLRPNERVWFNAFTTVTGILLLEFALIVCAVPILLLVSSSGHIDRHFFPGDAFVGWGSTVVAGILVASLFIGWAQFRQNQQRLRVEPWIGTHRQRAGYELVILESDRQIAYAVGGKDPQVVVTTGLATELTDRELRAVLEHERAHIRRGHRRFLALLGALEPLGRILPPIRRSLVASRSALEHAADSDTTDQSATRSALLKLNGISLQPMMAAFTAGDVADRIGALSDGGDQAIQPHGRALLYTAALCLMALSLAPMVMFWL